MQADGQRALRVVLGKLPQRVRYANRGNCYVASTDVHALHDHSAPDHIGPRQGINSLPAWQAILATRAHHPTWLKKS